MQKQMISLILTTLFMATPIMAFNLNPNETIIVCNNTIQCIPSVCDTAKLCTDYITNFYNDTTDDLVNIFNDTFSIILDEITVMDSRIGSCTNKTLCSESLSECMINLKTDRETLKKSLEDLSECKSGNEKCQAYLGMTEQQLNDQYCSDEISERDQYKNQRTTYALIAAAASSGIIWWIKSKGPSKHKDLETHEPRRGEL